MTSSSSPTVLAAPEVSAVEVSGFTTELSGNGDSTLALQETHGFRDFVLR